MTPEAASARSALLVRRAEIESAHREGASSFVTCSSLTLMMDGVIRSAFGTLEESSRTQLAVLALGGYGRAELCPHSDIDLMVLRAAGKDLESAGKAAKAFLHLLWDAGVDVGHSVRTVDEALALHGHSIDAWNSMLESRVICGDGQLAEALYGRLRQPGDASADRWLISGVLEAQASLHVRHGSSVKLLEPNIKKSAGGLRDLHSAYWLHRAHRVSLFAPHDAREPALKRFLDLLRAGGDLDPDEHQAALHALEFLLRVRHEMHYLRGSLHDTLEYALQLQVAGGLGYRDQERDGVPGAVTRAVEVFMREYYLHARVVHGTSQRLNNRFRELIEPVRHPDHAAENIRGLFFVHSDVLSVAPEVTKFSSAEEIFEAFVLAAERELDMDFRLRAVIGQSLDLLTEERLASSELASLFSRILRSGRVGATLRVMNDLNVLGTYLPEFGKLVAFFQHNVYHYFTADEHTIIAIANAEGLRERQGLLREVFRMLRRKDLLYLAILFHDIAKPDGLADHEITGVAVAEQVLQRLGMGDLFPDVAFLIRHHLMMEQIAFRRNIHDPETIRDFAGHFPRPELLDYLYVLTYADLSAVNTNVWTEWKSTILQELYQRASEVLRRNLQGAQIEAFHQAKRDAAVEQIVGTLSETLPRDHVERHVQGLQNDSYFALFSEEEIARHIIAGELRGPVDVAFAHSEGYTEVTIIARDAPFALSKFCAVLAANDANIFDANIFTRDDGIIIDRFRVSDAASHQQLEAQVCTKIVDDLGKVMGGSLDIEHLFAEHRRKWKRRPRAPVNPSIRTDVEFEGTARFTIIDVYAADSVGFLYRVTEAMSRMGLDIYFAKIATRVDGIIDAFYVLDRAGRPLSEQGRRDAVRQGILETVRQMADEELA
jgi:[protein-PII] uridylyltransferase